MKSFIGLLFVLVVLAFVEAKGQDYQVIHVKGEILVVDTDALLKPMDKISADVKIQFKTTGSMAAVLSSEKGRYIIKAKEETVEQSDLIYVLSSTVSPVRGGMSTRGGGINNTLDLKLYFAEAPYVWVGDELQVKLSTSTFPMNDRKFFFMRFTYKGELVNKKLDSEDDLLLLNKNTLFQIDGQAINAQSATLFELYYYDSRDEESELIADIDFVFIEKDELHTMLKTYDRVDDDTYYEIADILSDMYGKCDPLQLINNDK